MWDIGAAGRPSRLTEPFSQYNSSWLISPIRRAGNRSGSKGLAVQARQDVVRIAGGTRQSCAPGCQSRAPAMPNAAGKRATRPPPLLLPRGCSVSSGLTGGREPTQPLLTKQDPFALGSVSEKYM